MPLENAPLVVAAGGVVVRKKKSGPVVAVVHRPRHEDWSLPKGKLDPGETWEDAALREVFEETAITAKITDRLMPTAYEVGGKPKIVVWYLMSVKNRNKFKPNNEVDELRWVKKGDLEELLTRPDDYLVAQEALQLVE